MLVYEIQTKNNDAGGQEPSITVTHQLMETDERPTAKHTFSGAWGSLVEEWEEG